jgi:hypothetical protein
LMVARCTLTVKWRKPPPTPRRNCPEVRRK